MPADTAQTTQGATSLPPFKKLPFKAPQIEVKRTNAAVYLISRLPMGEAPRSIPHMLDEKAAEHPDRPWRRYQIQCNLRRG